MNNPEEEGTPDIEPARRWFRESSGQGHIKATTALGYLLLRFDNDEEAAKKLFITAAARGDAEAHYRIAQIHLTHSPEKALHGQARVHLQAAADFGHAAAQKLLALVYDEGIGGVRDPLAAFRWIQAAARQGDPEAELALAWRLETGFGVDQDFLHAVSWYLRAGRHGLENARAMARHVSVELSLTERELASRLAEGDAPEYTPKPAYWREPMQPAYQTHSWEQRTFLVRHCCSLPMARHLLAIAEALQGNLEGDCAPDLPVSNLPMICHLKRKLAPVCMLPEEKIVSVRLHSSAPKLVSAGRLASLHIRLDGANGSDDEPGPGDAWLVHHRDLDGNLLPQENLPGKADKYWWASFVFGQ